MMLFKTLSEAQKHVHPCSWIHVQILRCEVKGVTYFRTYEFDSSRHKCKECRNALRSNHKSNWRIASTGHVCERCGNPFASFVRQSRTKWMDSVWRTIKGCWASSGRLH